MSLMSVPIGQAASVTITDRRPAGLSHYGQAATDAWEVWTTLHKRRLGGQFDDEFTSMVYKGIPGFRWDGILNHVMRARLGQITQWHGVRIREWLSGTGNLVHTGGQGRAAVWWLRDQPWNDVIPQAPVIREVPSAEPVAAEADGATSVVAADAGPVTEAAVAAVTETAPDVIPAGVPAEAVSLADVRRCLRLLEGWLEGAGEREARLAAERDAAVVERDRLAEWRSMVESVAAPFLDALTSSSVD